MSAALIFVLAGTVLLGDTPPAVPPGAGSTGEYLAAHQDDLAPFFERNGAVLLKDAFPILLGLGGKIMLGVLVAGWFIDVLLARGFSSLFWPAYAKFTQALIYASGRLVLSLVLSLLLGLVFFLGLNVLRAGMPALAIVAVLALPALFIEVVWVAYLYRSKMGVSTGFYLALLAIHTVLIAVLVPIVSSGETKAAAITYVDECLAPRLLDAASEARQESALTLAGRDEVRNHIETLKTQISQAQADQKDLRKAIDARKNSADYIFSRLVKLRASGNLAEARTQFVAFLQQFPNDPHTEPAKGQLGEIDKALAEQDALQKEQQAEADRAAAKARAELLARAAGGQVTLSEMRAALLGKTPAEVTALFGTPTETDSDKWGYGRQIILDPLTHRHFGLTVNFSDGVVQGVDYYYGASP